MKRILFLLGLAVSLLSSCETCPAAFFGGGVTATPWAKTNLLNATNLNGSLLSGGEVRAGANVGTGYGGLEVRGTNLVMLALTETNSTSVSDLSWLFFSQSGILYWGIPGQSYAAVMLDEARNSVTEFHVLYGFGPANSSAVKATPAAVGIFNNAPVCALDVGGNVRAGQTSGEGLILTSPSGYLFRVTVDDTGVLSTTTYP